MKERAEDLVEVSNSIMTEYNIRCQACTFSISDEMVDVNEIWNCIRAHVIEADHIVMLERIYKSTVSLVKDEEEEEE